MKKLVVDRIENHSIAVCEDLETRMIVNIEVNKLPAEIKDGSIIVCDGNKYMIDKKLEEKRSKEIKEKMNKLWK